MLRKDQYLKQITPEQFNCHAVLVASPDDQNPTGELEEWDFVITAFNADQAFFKLLKKLFKMFITLTHFTEKNKNQAEIKKFTDFITSPDFAFFLQAIDAETNSHTFIVETKKQKSLFYRLTVTPLEAKKI